MYLNKGLYSPANVQQKCKYNKISYYVILFIKVYYFYNTF